MATRIVALNILKKYSISPACRSFTYGRIILNKPHGSGTSKPPTSSAPMGDVPGLSKRVVSYGSEPVGPGAAKNTDYKNPEYFSYNETSYFEAEIEMLKYRCPQPSSLKEN